MRGRGRERETESRVNGKLIGRLDNGFGLIFKPQSAAVPRFPGWRLLFGRSSAAGCIDVYASLFYVSVHERDIVYVGAACPWWSAIGWVDAAFFHWHLQFK